MSCKEKNADFISSLKRKRVSDKHEVALDDVASAPACFTNSAFSSTPKKLIGRRRKLQTAKEHTNLFMQNPCLEVKSISDLLAQRAKKEETNSTEIEQPTINPYEVVRKPPKKKKRESEIVEACFENPALNLEMPEKQFNPYEVLRERKAACAQHTQCFVNEALNLRGQDAPASLNPFEIHRCSAASLLAANPTGVENPALEDAAPTNLKIGLPFMPTVGCRIDFKNLPLSELTPSKLLAEKLCFSPVPIPKRSLGSISEESSMDIGRELDRYQLELENSINEAKLRKTCGVMNENKSPELTLQIEVEQKVTFIQKLEEIVEEEEEDKNISMKQQSVMEITEIKENSKLELNINQSLQSLGNYENEKGKLNIELPPQAAPTHNYTTEVIDNNNNNDDEEVSDVAYASEESDEDRDFKAPTPFVRAYRRDASPKLAVSKESLNSNKSANPEEHKKSLNVKNLIRNSIRKLMHPNQHNVDEEIRKGSHEKASEKHSNIISNLRHSLRRKPMKQPLLQEPLVAAEISILDSSERTMKFKSIIPQAEYAKIEELTNEKKHTLRNSIRRSTREMRQQFMKTVFHKNQEEYNFNK